MSGALNPSTATVLCRAPGQASVDLSVVIVSWNVCPLLRNCLRSVFNVSVLPTKCEEEETLAHLEVIVVDNASTDNTAAMIQSEFPSVRLIVNRSNVGFPAANNQGIALARGRCVLVLNPDTEIVGTALATLVAFADAHAGVGMVGPQLINPDGTVQSSRRRFPTLATAFFESTWLQPWSPRSVLRRYYVLDHSDDVIQDVDWVYGAAMLVKRAVLEEVGSMDEGYFMYSEELDWCRRIKEAGWRVVYLPAARVVHYGGKSSEQVVAARHIHFQTSKVRYFRKYNGVFASEAIRVFLLVGYVWQLALEGAKWLIGHKRPLRAERISAYRQVLRSRLRPGRPV